MPTHLEVIADGSFRNLTDEEVMQYAYAARYADYQAWFSVLWNGEWKTYPEIFKELGLTWEQYLERNQELLDRISAIEEREAEKEKLKRRRAGQSDDIISPAGTTSTRASYGTGPCGRCGEEHSYWNPGAAEYLCSRHWDDY